MSRVKISAPEAYSYFQPGDFAELDRISDELYRQARVAGGDLSRQFYYDKGADAVEVELIRENGTCAYSRSYYKATE